MKRKIRLSGNEGGCFVPVILLVIAVVLCFAFLPKLIDSLTAEKFPITQGGYLAYTYWLNNDSHQLRYEFGPVVNKKINLKVATDGGPAEDRTVDATFEYETGTGALLLGGIAPVWLPKKRLGKGGGLQGFRIAETAIYKGYDTWLAGEPRLKALYYDRATGFLVGAELSPPTVSVSTYILLNETNIPGLKKVD